MSREELIAALEKATGPGYALDHEIGKWRYAEAGLSSPAIHKNYTASIDAAMTLYRLVPERVPSNPRLACIEALKQRGETP